MTHKDDQDAGIEALKRKQGRPRPAFLNQDTLDRVAHGHAKELIELGAQSANPIKRVRSPNELTAREVTEVLREVILGRRTMAKIGEQTWDEVYACNFVVDIEGWRITIYNDCDELDYCEQAVSPDGQRWDFDPGDRTDPIALLSMWEHQCLERLLKAL